ncbi:MAG: metal ABC transporter solute-binding protein, Zn/Mn family [Phycisphaerae bacterium]|jgi:manganese/zinc/iron transport system substrate-binding protein
MGTSVRHISRRSLLGILCCLGACVSLTACKPANEPTADAGGKDQKLRVVATTAMVADIVERLGGDRIAVETLLGPGTDPHLYKPTPSDMRALQGADLIVYSGLKLEGKMTDTLENLAKSKPVLNYTDAMARERLPAASADNAEHGKQFDPHAWFDVSLWASGIDAARDALAKADPANAEKFAANANEYKIILADLDTWVREQIATIPQERRVLVTAHDAFGYFGRAYGIEVQGIQGLSTESEASLSDINRLVDELTKRKVPAVFVETSISPKNIEALVQGAKARGHDVRIGGSLFSDAMGEAGTAQGTYVGMVRHNVTQIVEALR